MIKKLKMEHFFNHFSPHPTGSRKHSLSLFHVPGKKVRDTVEEFKLPMICLCCLLFFLLVFLCLVDYDFNIINNLRILTWAILVICS
jgi:hypothetical protein